VPDVSPKDTFGIRIAGLSIVSRVASGKLKSRAVTHRVAGSLLDGPEGTGAEFFPLLKVFPSSCEYWVLRFLLIARLAE
jgi:hypothetical protein